MNRFLLSFLVFIIAGHGFCDEAKTQGDYVSINDIEIYYEVHGQGEPMLLLHGGMGSSGRLEYQIDYFADMYQVIAPDCRGRGRTLDSHQPITYDLMADDMIKLLDHLDIDSCYIIGYSDGGNIGLIMSNRNPERVTKLVAIGANFMPDGLTQEMITEIKNATDESWPEVTKHYKELNPDPSHWPILFEKITNLWLSDTILNQQQLNEIKVKTLIVVGDSDCIRMDHTTKLFESIPDAQLCVIPGASHSVLREKPELVNWIIADFMR
jgi:pimeloyl-ACP methyl ester carboxylesterase